VNRGWNPAQDPDTKLHRESREEGARTIRDSDDILVEVLSTKMSKR
jgi:hypothetical protein